MSQHAALDPALHRDLRVDMSRGAALGDALMFAPTFPAEFRNVQAHYPIVFHKDAAGRFQPVALFGFGPGQNLYLDGTRWEAGYLPLAVERQPFLIGSGAEPSVHVDLDSPRVGAATGEPLFDAGGQATPTLERAIAVLRTLHEGLQSNAAFVATLLEHDLLESFVLDVELDDGRQHRLSGFYAIHEEHLRSLAPETAGRLHAQGWLEAAYMALASLGQLRGLIERAQGHARAR